MFEFRLVFRNDNYVNAATLTTLAALTTFKLIK